jgi:hypothetical protein
VTPDVISSLIDLGSAGAVIAVVIIFLNYLKKRESDWQDFFTSLTTSNKADMNQVRDVLEKVALGINCLSIDLRVHDSKVDDRIHVIKVMSSGPSKVRPARKGME